MARRPEARGVFGGFVRMQATCLLAPLLKSLRMPLWRALQMLLPTIVASMLGLSMALAAAAAPLELAGSSGSSGSSALSMAGGASIPSEASLEILNREIVTLRASLGGANPATRVERALARMRDVPVSEIDGPIRSVPFALGGDRGVQFLLGDRMIFTLLEGDRAADDATAFEVLVAQTQARLEAVRQDWHRVHDDRVLLRGLLRAVLATALFGAFLWGLGRLSARWRLRLVRGRGAGFGLRQLGARYAAGTVRMLALALVALAAFEWLREVLGAFVITEPLARGLGDWLWSRLLWVAQGTAAAVPGLATVVIVLVLTRVAVDVLGQCFRAVEQGRLNLPGSHPETIGATRRIVILLVWGLGLAIAWPYLPGSSSEAFKGLSVLFGLMITLGSTGLVTQAMSGLVLVYSRALREGDYVEVNGVQGVVREVNALATKVVNIRNEEITIPNSVLVASPIHNYSKLAAEQGTLISTRVTIGYDAPWRQVHALLIEATSRTEGLRSSPEPRVYQRALSDFYVEYELFVSIDRPLQRVPVLSDLHGHIQDAFNEAGLQIMSPHFMTQPEQAVLGEVPRR